MLMECDRPVETSRHCITAESVFHTKKGTSVIPVKRDVLDAFTVDEDGGFVLNDSIARSKLELQPVLVETAEEAREEQARNSPIHVADEQKTGSEDAGERATTPE